MRWKNNKFRVSIIYTGLHYPFNQSSLDEPCLIHSVRKIQGFNSNNRQSFADFLLHNPYYLDAKPFACESFSDDT